MPSQLRIAFLVATYHVMARGDRREAIVRDGKDRRTFLRTLAECCEKSGWNLYALVPMTNHDHWVLQIVEAFMDHVRLTPRA